MNCSCGLTSYDSVVAADDGGYAGNIRISLAHPFNLPTNDYELLFASAVDTAAMGLCIVKNTPTCTPGGPGFYPADLIYNSGARTFFKTKSSALLEDGLTIKVVASGNTGVTLDSRNIQFVKGAGAAPSAVANASAATAPVAATASTTATSTAPTTIPTDTTTAATNFAAGAAPPSGPAPTDVGGGGAGG